MKKRKVGRTLSRDFQQRKALMRTLLVSLISFRKIETTLAKAKELRPFAEKMVTKAKKAENDKVATLRELKKDLPEDAARELIEIASEFKERNGGYTRILKLPNRKSDAAQMAIVEWVGLSEKKDSSKPESKEKKSEDKKEKKDNKKK